MVVGLAAVGLVEGGGDDGRDVVGDAGGRPRAAGVRAGRAGAELAGSGEDVAGRVRVASETPASSTILVWSCCSPRG